MRSLVKTTTVVAAVGVFLLSGLPSEAQEATPDPQSPELKPLQRFIGSWDWDVVLKSAEPDNTKMKADVTVASILRGRMIQHNVIWSPGNMHALALMAYDAENKVYQEWYFDSNGGIPRGENRGVWNEATKTFSWKGKPADGITSAATHRFIDDKTLEWIMVQKDRAGNVVLHMEATAKRK